MTNEMLELADRFAEGSCGLSVEGDVPRIVIAVSTSERDLIVAALRAPAEVLENVRKGIAALQNAHLTSNPGLQIPLDLYKACQALTHIVGGSRS